jgi:hypothetical protein
LLAGWLAGWLGLLVFFGRPASQQTPKTFDIKRKKKIKRVDISSSTQLYPLSVSLSQYNQKRSLFLFLSLFWTKIIESTRQAKQTKVVIGRRVRWRSRLDSPGGRYSLSPFFLSPESFPWAEKKRNKKQQKRKVTTRAAKVCDRKTRQSAIGRSGD